MTDQRTPDDLVGELSQRFGEAQLTAYTSLARSRGVSVLAVLRAAVDDDLQSIVEMPVVESEPPG